MNRTCRCLFFLVSGGCFIASGCFFFIRTKSIANSLASCNSCARKRSGLCAGSCNVVDIVVVEFSSPEETVLVESGTAMKYLANSSDPVLGLTWVAESFVDSGWTAGTYGVGYEDTTPGAENLILTTVTSGVNSVYTRTTFNVENVSLVNSIFVGADWDDGYVMWINGVEVHRSAEMPGGDPSCNTTPTEHESSNGADPDYGTLVDVSSDGIPALVDGANVLAVGIWNETSSGGDDVLV